MQQITACTTDKVARQKEAKVEQNQHWDDPTERGSKLLAFMRDGSCWRAMV